MVQTCWEQPVTGGHTSPSRFVNLELSFQEFQTCKSNIRQLAFVMIFGELLIFVTEHIPARRAVACDLPQHRTEAAPARVKALPLKFCFGKSRSDDPRSN